MSSLAPTSFIEHMRPLLGTYVAIGVGGLRREAANHAINAAFAVVEAIHRLMSFHETDSDISALNRHAADRPVRVADHTYEVISRALDVSRVSGGAFDLSIAPYLVAWGFLPRPAGAPDPHPAAAWRDVELLADNHIRYRRPLWIDVGGIAKGYAVDCATDALRCAGVGQSRVNAGGDVRVSGPGTERIVLRTDRADVAHVPVIALSDGSIAGSSGRAHLKRRHNANVGPHVDGVGKGAVGTDTFAAVLAQDCMTADALTKVALALEEAAAPALRHFGALAYLQGADGTWRAIGEAR